MNKITIRTAALSEAQAYRDLRLEALKNHPQSFGSDYNTYVSCPLQYWADRLNSFGENSAMFFADHVGEFVGMCGIFRELTPKEHHTATIVSLYVKPDWRGQRISERLIERTIQWAVEHDIIIVKLAVVSTNSAAIHCYLRMGFKEYGLEPQALCYEGQMYDMQLMFKEIV